MNSCVVLTSAFLMGTLLILAVVQTAESGPISSHKSPYFSDLESEPDSQYVMEMLARLGQSIINNNNELENNKRGLDLGLSRGFSGSQAAKHLMGLAAANYAGGPGRKRRDAPETS